MISGYTREAGVRGLERKLGEICRKAARETLEKKKKSVKITEENLEKYLGKVRFTIQTLNDQDEIGIVRGLAWTSVGGDTLQIEVNTMPGKRRIQTDRSARGCNEGICAGRYQLHKICEQPVSYLRRIFP